MLSYIVNYFDTLLKCYITNKFFKLLFKNFTISKNKVKYLLIIKIFLVIDLNKKILLIIFLISLLIVPVAINIATTVPRVTTNFTRPDSIVLTNEIGILGGGEEWDSPIDPAFK